MIKRRILIIIILTLNSCISTVDLDGYNFDSVTLWNDDKSNSQSVEYYSLSKDEVEFFEKEFFKSEPIFLATKNADKRYWYILFSGDRPFNTYQDKIMLYKFKSESDFLVFDVGDFVDYRNDSLAEFISSKLKIEN